MSRSSPVASGNGSRSPGRWSPEPEILLLDEPLSALDANLVVRMQGVLSRLQKDLGITFVYVTHSQSEAFAKATGWSS